MAKFILKAAATALATAAFAVSANAVENTAACESLEGDVMQLNGADVCLLPIRSEADIESGLTGVTSCDGELKGGGTWCLAAIGGGSLPKPVSTPKPTQAELESMTQSGLATASTSVTDSVTNSVVDTVTDAVIDAGTDLATDVATDAVKSAVEGSGL